MKHRVERQVGQEVLGIETGLLAKQAAGSVLVSYGETTVLVAAATGSPRAGIDFFPLTCDYRERTAAAGKFPGGFLKREGRPTMKETLTSRLIDRDRSDPCSQRGSTMRCKFRRRRSQVIAKMILIFWP